jgi:carboxymethylenebutenolidase
VLSTNDLEIAQLPVGDGTTMAAFVARPDGTANAPGIIVFQDAFGVNEHFKDVALRFAAAGFTAIVPELYHRTGAHVHVAFGDVPAARPHSDAITFEMQAADTRAAYAWMIADGGVAPDRVAAVGFCYGGRVAYLANATAPLAAAVSYYAAGLATPEYLALAEKQHGPNLMFWAGRDQHVPREKSRMTEDALTAAKKVHAHVLFSHAEHAFFCNDRPSYDAGCARASWGLMLDVLTSRSPAYSPAVIPTKSPNADRGELKTDSARTSTS